MPSRAGGGCGGGGLPGSSCHAAAVDRRGDAAVKRIVITLLVAGLTLTGCQRKPAQSDETTGIKDMQGLPGRPAAGARTSRVAVKRTEAGRLGFTFRRATVPPVRGY